MKQKNARFWVYEHGWVKLTLKPGQRLTAVSGGPTEEGYSWGSTTWTHSGNMVDRFHATRSRDCDGPHEYYSDDFCPLTELRACDKGDEFPEYKENAGIFAPAWKHVRCHQRDHYAEAMGY